MTTNKKPTRKIQEETKQKPLILEGERILPDDYPVYSGYIYLLNGIPIISQTTGTLSDFKKHIGSLGYIIKEIRSCDIVERGLISL